MGLSLDAVKCDESLLLAQYAYSCMDCYRPLLLVFRISYESDFT